MTDLLKAAASWEALLIACVVFGFAPGLILRFITLAFDADDPRRQELRAEMHVVPRIERPLWVAEQIEVALCEGLLWKVRAFAYYHVVGSRLIWRSRLESGTEMNRLHPDTFWVPPSEEKARIRPGTMVKVIFVDRSERRERMWVEVTEAATPRFTGTLSNLPCWVRGVKPESRVRFTADDIIDIDVDTLLPEDQVVEQGS